MRTARLLTVVGGVQGVCLGGVGVSPGGVQPLPL